MKIDYQFGFDWISNAFPIWDRVLAPLKRWNIKGLEIGCYEGRATLWLMENIFTHPESVLYVVDTFKGSKDHQENDIDFSRVQSRFLHNLQEHSENIRLTTGLSENFLLSRLGSEYVINPEFELIFIDGSHLAADVWIDLTLSWLNLKPGGILIIDDFGWGSGRPSHETPQPAVEGFLNSFIGRYEVLHKDYQVILKKL